MPRGPVKGGPWIAALLAGLAAAGCTGVPTGLGPGAACVRSAQCQGGLVCNMGMCTSDLGGFGTGMPPMRPFDAGPVDAQVDDAEIDAPDLDSGPPEDTGPPVDAPMPPVDAFVPPDDAFVPPDDAFVPPVDAFVPPDDAFVPPDAFVDLDAG